MAWKKYFKNKILERGYQYYLENCVQGIEWRNNQYYAVVEGNEYYSVTINQKRNHEYEMTCDCPYAQEGNNCKHMAAVLYEIESIEKRFQQDLNHSNIFEEVNSCNEMDLKEFLIELLEEDEELYERFKCRFNLDPVKNIYEQLDDIFDYKINYNDEDSTYEFSQELVEFMEEAIPDIIQSNPLDTVQLLFQIIERIDYYLINDEYGGIQEVYDLFVLFMKQVIQSCSFEMKKDIYNQLIEIIETRYLDLYYRDIYSIILHEFKEENFFNQNKEYFKNKIEENKEEYPTLTLFYINCYLQLLFDYPEYKEEYDHICKEFWMYEESKEMLIDYLMHHQFYEECIILLNNIIFVDKNKHIEKYALKLKDAYLSLNKKEEVMQCLKTCLIELGGNIEIYKEYKSFFDEQEWIQIKDELLKECEKNDHLGDFYKEEKMFKALIELVQFNQDFEYYKRYESVLKKKYPSRCLGMYERHVAKILRYSSNRDTYKYACSIIKQMPLIRGGENRARSLIAYYKDKYSNRSALKDELNKIRFQKI